MGRRLLDTPPFTAVGLLWPGRPLSAPASGSGPGPDAVPGAPGFRLVASNGLRSNRRLPAWARSVLAPAPDVLCVAELTPGHERALAEAGIGERLACGGAQAVRMGSVGTGVWSGLAVLDAWTVDAGYALAVARVVVGDVPVTAVAVHTVAPTDWRTERRWHTSFAAVEEVVAAVDPGEPVVLAGDWNATLAHGPMRALLSGSAGRPLRDAHTDAGRWRARTWHARLPTAGLDRVLVSDELAVRAIRELPAPGSDHRTVVADLTLR